MARIFATAMAAVTIIALGIAAMSFRVKELDAAGLTGADAEAFNLTKGVTTDTMAITGNAIPRLFIVVLLVLLVVMLLLNRS